MPSNELAILLNHICFMSSKIINITESAEKYLAKLLKDKKETDIAVRIFISDPGTPRAETCLSMCTTGTAL